MEIPRALSLFFRTPGMYIPRTDFYTAAAFILGFDKAREGDVLVGFREWLVLKLGYGDNFAWPELILRLAYPEPGARPRELPASDQERLMGLLFEAVEAFWKAREDAGGPEEIFRRHADWLGG